MLCVVALPSKRRLRAVLAMLNNGSNQVKDTHCVADGWTPFSPLGDALRQPRWPNRNTGSRAVLRQPQWPNRRYKYHGSRNGRTGPTYRVKSLATATGALARHLRHSLRSSPISAPYPLSACIASKGISLHHGTSRLPAWRCKMCADPLLC